MLFWQRYARAFTSFHVLPRNHTISVNKKISLLCDAYELKYEAVALDLEVEILSYPIQLI